MPFGTDPVGTVIGTVSLGKQQINCMKKQGKRMVLTDNTAHREASDVIEPEDYARWRESYLGALTERLEEGAILRLTGDVSGKYLLDLGCGDGTYSIAASRRGARVTGVDISDAMLKSARRRAAACGASVEWPSSFRRSASIRLGHL